MAMTTRDAIAVQAALDFIASLSLFELRPTDGQVTLTDFDDQDDVRGFIDAMAELADRTHTRLGAGTTGDRVRERLTEVFTDSAAAYRPGRPIETVPVTGGVL